jgi:hypothetical protein
MIEVGQAANGYVIEVRVPFKKKKRKEGKELCCDYPGSTEKQFIAKDNKELISIMKNLMPLLDEDFTSEEEFDAAFEEAAE